MKISIYFDFFFSPVDNVYQLLDYVFRLLIEGAQAKGSLNVSVDNIMN